MNTIYRTPEGRAAVLAHYDRRLAVAGSSLVSRVVDTRVGPTHVLTGGPAGAPPLVLVHGALSCALDLAEPLAGMDQRHRCHFVDVPGEPNRSSEARLAKRSDAYGEWMLTVLDALELDRVAMLGVSQGGFVSLKLAAIAPERLSRLVLIVPEGLARPRVLPLLRRFTGPLLRYRLSPTDANARRFVASLSTPGIELPETMIEGLCLAMRHVRAATQAAPLYTAEELAGLRAPVLVVAGGRDVLFPSDRLERRARAVIPSLRDVIVVPHAGHIYFETAGGPVTDAVREFLAEEG